MWKKRNEKSDKFSSRRGRWFRRRIKSLREKKGVAIQDTGIDNILTGRELFFSTARLWGYSVKDSETRTNELLELVGLTEAADRRVKTYSGGMKRRLDLGLSLVNSPEILFLDEPTTGLDPGSRRVLWDEIKRLRDRGVTVILTTQYLEEADELADRIAIIDEGLVVAEGTSDQLKASIGGDVITFSFSNNSDLENAKKTLTDYKQEGNDLRITVQNGASKIPSFVNKLTENNIEIDAVSASKPTLDDVFLKVTGYRLEGSETSTKSEQPIKES